MLLSAAAILAVAVSQTHTQQAQPAKPLVLVMSTGPGSIEIPTTRDWKPQIVDVYDKGTRPVLQLLNELTGISASFILYPNQSGKPTSEGCRADGINPIADYMAKQITDRHDSEATNKAGKTIATTSYLLALGATNVKQHNLYGFLGDANTCAEVHLSQVGNKPHGEAELQAALAAFNPDLTYQPNALDYFRIGSLLMERSPALAAPYYRSSLDHLPTGDTELTQRRIATDELVMALGMSGDLAGSRAVAAKATITDPDYPINYYNLACADAEQGDAANARLHLQQAFDRKANALHGESLPDPTKDNSILKLKGDHDFWSFVESLVPSKT